MRRLILILLAASLALPHLALAQTPPFFNYWPPTWTYSSGNMLSPVPVAIASSVGPNLAPGIAPANWTCGAGWDCSVAGTLNKNADGTGTAVPNPAIASVVGTTYEVRITVGAVSVASGATYTLGGTPGPALTAAGSYVHYVTASTTATLIVLPTPTTTRFTITAISVRAMSGGGLEVQGALSVRSPATFNGPVLLSDGTATALSVAFLSDPDTGIKYNASGSALWYTNATASMKWDTNLTLGQNMPVRWTSGDANAAADTYLYRDSVNKLQSGVDSTSPSAQTHKGPDAITNADVAGGDLGIAGGNGTGTGATGRVRLQAGPQTTTGTTATTPVDKAVINGRTYSAADASSITVLSVVVPADSGCTLRLDYKAESGNATTSQTEGGSATFVCHEVKGASTYACATPAEVSTQLLSAGTLTTTWATTPAATTALTFLADTSVATPAAWLLDYNVTYNSGCTLSFP